MVQDRYFKAGKSIYEHIYIYIASEEELRATYLTSLTLKLNQISDWIIWLEAFWTRGIN